MSGWEVRFSNSRQLPYFYNASTGQSVWEPPKELSQDQIQRLPGAAQHLSAPKNTAVPAGQVRASHILAKSIKSRRPSSWREVSPAQNVQPRQRPSAPRRNGRLLTILPGEYHAVAGTGATDYRTAHCDLESFA